MTRGLKIKRKSRRRAMRGSFFVSKSNPSIKILNFFQKIVDKSTRLVYNIFILRKGGKNPMIKFIKKVLAAGKAKQAQAQNRAQLILIHKGLEDRGF